ncbi:MAG: hypothetical protein H5T74_00585 [Actinobacteria bacterium]|nr:hypothetical protein [Actinomycetota bacterium]
MAEKTNLEDLVREAREAARAAGDDGGGAGAGMGYSALPGLVRELIRTPGFKELLLIHLRDVNPANAAELVRAFLWEDVAFSMSVLGASPSLVNWVVELLLELGKQLNNFTLDILKDFIARLGKDLDTERLKEIPSAYAPLVNQLLLEDREALDALIAGIGAVAERMLQAGERTWRKVWNTADFGKVRVGLTAHLEGRRAELEGEPGLFNPVAISNLLGVVPPLANYLLRVMTRALQALSLPAEILANAVFQLLEDIDMAEMGGLVNALAGLVTALHRGNLVLGRDEPRFKAVLERVSRDLVDSVDGEAFREMLVALKEDGAVIGQVLSGYIYATPDSTVQAARALYLAVGAALRAAAEHLRRFSELPPEAVAAMDAYFEEAVDPRELARVINYNAVLLNKAFDARPDLLAGFAGKLLAGLDTEALAEAGKKAALQVKEAALADPAVRAALEPEAVAERINAVLAAFNAFAWRNPGLMADKAARVLGAINVDDLVLAASEVAAAGFAALRRHPEVIGKVAKPLLTKAAKPAAAAAAALGVAAAAVLLVRRRR